MVEKLTKLLLEGHKRHLFYDSIAAFLIANDVVPVVRCKDCIHWHETEGVCLKIYSDGAVSPYAWQDRNPDDFCSYGERRNDAGT